MKTYYAVLWAHARVQRIFVLHLPSFGEKGFYHNSLTREAFKKNEQKRRFPYLFEGHGHKEPAPWGFQLMEDFQIRDHTTIWDRVTLKEGEPRPDLGDFENNLRYEERMFELLHFSTMFDFYRFLEYSYVKKKYFNEERIQSWITHKDR